MPTPKAKKSPFATWANATLSFPVDNLTGVPVVDPHTGNKSYPKKTIVIKCILNPVRLISAKRKDDNPGADTNRIGMQGYLVEPFLPNLPEGIEHNAIADCVISVKQGTKIIESRVGRFALDLTLQSNFFVSPITGASVSGEFFL